MVVSFWLVDLLVQVTAKQEIHLIRQVISCSTRFASHTEAVESGLDVRPELDLRTLD